MRIKTLARGLSVGLVLAVMLTIVGVPAASAAPVGTASITSARTFLAGTPDAAITIQVTNTAPLLNQTTLSANPSVNNVTIVPPPGRYTPISVVSAPTGWTGTLTVHGDFVFDTTGAGIAPGNGTASFTVATSITRPTVDNTRAWRVDLSNDRGVTGAEATPPTNDANALRTTIKVLQVTSVRFTAPNGVLDGSSTTGQPVTAQLDVFNAGSGTLNVTPQITFANVLSGTPAPGTAEASGSATCPGTQSLASLASATFTCTVTLTHIHDAGRITVVGNASGTHATDGSATALTSTLSASAMTAAAFSFVAQTLQPTEVSPGKPFTFRATVNKTGQVGVTLTKANTTLTFGPPATETCGNPPAACPTFRAELDQPATFAGGTQNGVVLQFKTATVPAGLPADTVPPQGYRNYTPTLTITGADENDFAVSRSLSTDNVLVDALGPIIDVISTPPPSQVPPAPAAATDDQPVSFSGTITDRGANCGGCVITSAVIRQFNSAQVPIAGADIPVTINNNGGNLTGSFSGKFARDADGKPLAFYMALQVVGKDLGGNATTRQSNILEVDNVLPAIAAAETGGRNPDGTHVSDQTVARTTIDVTISELIRANAVTPADFTVDGHRVAAAEPRPPQTSASFDTVRLTVDPKLGRNEEPVVTYAPTAATRGSDRVGLRVLNASVTAIDGILPALPTINSIGSGATSARQEGQFFTNDDTPDISVTIDPGDTVTVYEDHPTLGTQGQIDANDIPRCSKKANPPVGQQDPDAQVTVICASSSFGNANRNVTLLARSFDARGNIGNIRNELLSLDFIAPAFKTAVRQASNLVVTMTEKLTTLLGRNDRRDWRVRGREAGEDLLMLPSEVQGQDDTRTLTKSDSAWNSPVVVTRIDYVWDGIGQGARYADRAGNDLPNQFFAVSLA